MKLKTSRSRIIPNWSSLCHADEGGISALGTLFDEMKFTQQTHLHRYLTSCGNEIKYFPISIRQLKTAQHIHEVKNFAEQRFRFFKTCHADEGGISALGTLFSQWNLFNKHIYINVSLVVEMK